MAWPFKKKEEKKQGDVIIPSCVYDCPRSNKCPKWVVLKQTRKLDNGQTVEEEEGKCCEAWIPQLLVELKEVLKAR